MYSTSIPMLMDREELYNTCVLGCVSGVYCSSHSVSHGSQPVHTVRTGYSCSIHVYGRKCRYSDLDMSLN